MTQLVKGKIVVGGITMQFPFNPTKFSKSVGVQYAETRGAGANLPILSFSGGNTPTIDLEIYLNSRSEEHDLKGFIRLLQDTLPYESEKQPWNTPPKSLIFAYGWFVKRCQVSKLDINYTMFDSTLEPIEATVNMTLLVHAEMKWWNNGKRLDI